MQINRKYRKKRYPKFLILCIVVCLILLSTGYAYINSDLGISTSAMARHNSWNIEIRNIVVSSETNATHESNTQDSTINFELNFSTQNSKYVITFDVVNTGTLDGYLKNINSVLETDFSNKNSIETILTYSDGKRVNINDRIRPQEVKSMILTIEYNPTLATDLRFSNIYDYSFNLNYQFVADKEMKLILIRENNSGEYEKEVIDTKLSEENIIIDNKYNNKIITCDSKNIEFINNNIILNKNEMENTVCYLTNYIVFSYDLVDSKNEKYIEDINKTQDYKSILLDDLYLEKNYQNNIYYSYDGYINVKANYYLDLNGKTMTLHTNQLNVYDLTIDGSTNNSQIILDEGSIFGQKIKINGGLYSISDGFSYESYHNNYDIGGITSNELTINNASLSLENSNLIAKYSFMEINDSDIMVTGDKAGIYSNGYNIYINNSTINSNTNMVESGSGRNSIFVCNSTITTTNNTFDTMNSNLIYYNSTFNNGLPTFNTQKPGTTIINESFACDTNY